MSVPAAVRSNPASNSGPVASTSPCSTASCSVHAACFGSASPPSCTFARSAAPICEIPPHPVRPQVLRAENRAHDRCTAVRTPAAPTPLPQHRDEPFALDPWPHHLYPGLLFLKACKQQRPSLPERSRFCHQRCSQLSQSRMSGACQAARPWLRCASACSRPQGARGACARGNHRSALLQCDGDRRRQRHLCFIPQRPWRGRRLGLSRKETSCSAYSTAPSCFLAALPSCKVAAAPVPIRPPSHLPDQGNGGLLRCSQRTGHHRRRSCSRLDERHDHALQARQPGVAAELHPGTASPPGCKSQTRQA